MKYHQGLVIFQAESMKPSMQMTMSCAALRNMSLHPTGGCRTLKKPEELTKKRLVKLNVNKFLFNFSSCTYLPRSSVSKSCCRYCDVVEFCIWHSLPTASTTDELLTSTEKQYQYGINITQYVIKCNKNNLYFQAKILECVHLYKSHLVVYTYQISQTLLCKLCWTCYILPLWFPISIFKWSYFSYPLHILGIVCGLFAWTLTNWDRLPNSKICWYWCTKKNEQCKICLWISRDINLDNDEAKPRKSWADFPENVYASPCAIPTPNTREKIMVYM